MESNSRKAQFGPVGFRIAEAILEICRPRILEHSQVWWAFRQPKPSIKIDVAWQLIAEFCERCDFIAVQEVQDSLESLRSLRDRLGKNYALLVSDIGGGVPGRSGMSACSTL
jgi:hypothetical protein